MQCNKFGPISTFMLSTFFNDKQGFKKNSAGPSKKSVDCSSQIAVPSMIPNPSENVNRETTSFTTPPTSSIEPLGSNTPIKNIRICACFRQEFQTGLPSLF